ncbi:hypothetical protein [Rhodoblastus sp.]|uniref:hypothetical protein n=1 Tax=Rhodoblastus sp. TaxID=1962975 RepID=UPI0025F3A9A4|nr:hypothetical protein [Rhodoblastus sp.]
MRFSALTIAAALAAASTAAMSCGYDDPAGVSTIRGMLNFIYPKSLYVIPAVLQAQANNIIARDDRPAAVKVLLGYQQAVAKLGLLRDRLAIVSDDRQKPAFAIILIGPALWTRFEPDGDGLAMMPHAEGPARGDVVLVTEESVISALVDGRLTAASAAELGLIRYYGAAESLSAAQTWLERATQKTHASATRSLAPTPAEVVPQ